MGRAGETPALQQERHAGGDTGTTKERTNCRDSSFVSLRTGSPPQNDKQVVMGILRVFGEEMTTEEEAYRLQSELKQLLGEWVALRCGDQDEFRREETVGIESSCQGETGQNAEILPSLHSGPPLGSSG